MKVIRPETGAANQQTTSRQSTLLWAIATAAALVALLTMTTSRPAAERPGETAGDLQPKDARIGLFDAMKRFPLVALGERHQLQEFHDFLTALLLHPDLPEQLTDIVVEFGNTRFQDVADRFVLDGQPVANADLQQIWRNTIGGGVLWDAPVYAQFFRTVRAVNRARAPGRRLRVLLGDPPFDHSRVRGAADKDYVQGMEKQRDAHYAAVVEREVLAKGRRALLIAGSGHLLRGIQDNFKQPNAVTRLEKKHPGKVFVGDLLLLPPGHHRDGLLHRVQVATTGWARPSFALLVGTWLGDLRESSRPWINSMAYRATDAAAARYGAQADAVLYFGPGESLTASRADPAIYRSGDYAAELKRLSQVSAELGNPVDYISEGLRISQAGPSWFAQR
jgi:hypothetical protein